ncbi:MAG TPA: sugar ABC transporter permease [Candidatus Dormibacteraeota bacterium]|jgi:multiple sugar transport system permease protein|nr:sugar ABC transporter permease [Candidatus Dormibacteraeota bacterium]
MARSRQERLVYQLLLPVFGSVFVIATIPFVLAVIQAVTSDSRGFVGFDNFARALGNPLLYESIKQTAIYAAIALPTEILGGLGIALLVHRTVRSSAIRAAIYIAAMIPIVIPQIAVGVIFRLVYAPDYGILNVLLGQTGPNQPLWLSSPPLAMIATASVDIWQWTPFVYLIMFAGFQTVPSESVEAAQVDGANAWTQFRHIELPYLRPLLLLVLFFRIADVIRVFDHVYVLTGGGPGTTTQFLSLYIYRIGFKFSDLGQASALAVVVMVAMTVFYTIVSRFLPADRG